MSSGFVSETELAERRRVRQEEWDKVRTAEQPVGTFVRVTLRHYASRLLLFRLVTLVFVFFVQRCPTSSTITGRCLTGWRSNVGRRSMNMKKPINSVIILHIIRTVLFDTQLSKSVMNYYDNICSVLFANGAKLWHKGVLLFFKYKFIVVV